MDPSRAVSLWSAVFGWDDHVMLLKLLPRQHIADKCGATGLAQWRLCFTETRTLAKNKPGAPRAL